MGVISTHSPFLVLAAKQSKSADHGVIAFMRTEQTGVVAGNTLAAAAGGVVFNGDTSGFVLSNNTILNATTLGAYVAATPLVTVSPSSPGMLSITAVCSTPGAVMRYTLDGSRVTPVSSVWPTQGVTVGMRALPVMVKAFATGLIESAVSGGVFGVLRSAS